MQGESSVEALVCARRRNTEQLLLGRVQRLVLLAEVYHVSGLCSALLQVPNLEVLRLINSEELADACSKPRLSLRLQRALLLVLSLLWLVALIEVQLTPLDLSDRTLAFLVPDSHRARIVLVI